MKRIALLLTLMFLLIFGSASAQIPELQISEDGSQLCLLTPDALRVLPMANGGLQSVFNLTEDNQRFEAYSAATRLVVACTADSREIAVYDTDSLRETLRIKPESMALSLAVSPDGKKLLVDSADTISASVYDLESGELLQCLSGFETAAPVYHTSFAPDGEHVLWNARGSFQLQNIADSQFGAEIHLWDFPTAYTLSPDVSRLLVAIADESGNAGLLLALDSQNGAETGRIRLSDQALSEIAFSADGKWCYAADSQSVYRVNMENFTSEDQSVLSPHAKLGDPDGIVRIAVDPANELTVMTYSGSLQKVSFE